MLRILSTMTLLALAATHAGAQQMHHQFSLETRALSAEPASLFSAPAQRELSMASSSMRRVGEHALYTLGFTLVGSGLGYFASQVAYSDWDKVNNSTFASERRAFSITGAAVGAVAGFVLGSRAGNTGVGNRIAVRQELAGADFVPAEEVEAASGTTAYEVIQVLRPSWLVERGTRGFAETGTGTASGREIMIVPGAPTIKVYVDNAQIGGIESLHNIQKSSIISIQRLSAAEATNRWGAGHTHGAILIQSIRNR